MHAVFLSTGLHKGVNDTPEHCGVEVWVDLSDVLCQLRGYSPSPYLGQEAELGDVQSHQSLNLSVSECRVEFMEGLRSLLSSQRGGSGGHGQFVAHVDGLAAV